jgi:drug/metabolite transporter (DMT)-like permease
VFSALTGFLFLGERISADGFAGILLVVLGAYLVNFEFADRGGLKALLAPLSAIIHHRGSRLMLSVAVIYSVTSVFGKGALQYAPAASFGPFYFALLGLISAGLFASSNRGNLSVLWRKPLPHIAIGCAMALRW